MSLNRIGSVLGALTISLTMAAVTAPAGSAATAPTALAAVAPVAFGGSAYGSEVKIAGPLVNSGKTAFVAIGCTQRTPITKRNSTVAVDIPGVGHVGAVENDATTRGNDTTDVYTAQTQSHVADASLLPGVIKVGAIETEATASKDADGYHAGTDFSIASLSIGGTKVVVNAAGNQLINIPGVGSLTLGESNTSERASSSSASVTAIVLRLDNGTVVRIGHSQASLDSAVNALFSGGAYGSTVEVAGRVTSGRSANQPIPCPGTQGRTRVNEVASVNLDELGTAQVVRSTVLTKQSPLPEAHAMNEIADVNIGLLRLQGIVASVNVFEAADGTVTYNTNGTKLAKITLAGVNIAVPAPGGSVDLLGVGTLTFFEVTERADDRGANVVAVRLTLADNTEVVLGSATAAIK